MGVSEENISKLNKSLGFGKTKSGKARTDSTEIEVGEKIEEAKEVTPDIVIDNVTTHIAQDVDQEELMNATHEEEENLVKDSESESLNVNYTTEVEDASNIKEVDIKQCPMLDTDSNALSGKTSVDTAKSIIDTQVPKGVSIIGEPYKEPEESKTSDRVEQVPEKELDLNPDDLMITLKGETITKEKDVNEEEKQGEEK